MSKTIDEKVVEMRFDNSHFEQHTKETLSTLDKLKQKLNLTGASKSLENINTSANKINLSGMTGAIETVHSKFSALEVMGVTALANITNSAVNAGKRIVNALTLEPVMTGFQEYELKMDSVKTIMASTGEDVETVNKYLDELNKYSDQTIYKFSDMTQNIGKFTNAGVKLEDAVLAMKGLSNEAAVSGANANEASRAMYNFAQALSMGYVQLIDWKSIENANMATVEFKTQLLNSAVAAKKVTKSSDGMYKVGKKTFNLQQMFKDGLKEQWLTSDVLIETLKDYADETTEIGKKAFAAAQDVTKFTQMFDILKETAQSGWAKTWELIFGDIDKAKALFTPLTNFFSGIIDGISDARNKLLKSALGKSFTGLMDKVNNSAKSVKKVVDSVKDYAKVVDEIIGGKWGNGQKRWDALTKAGYDWAHAQNLVNEKLGCSVRHTTKYKEAQDGVEKSQKKTKKTTGDLIVELVKLSDAELKAKGYTDDQIEAFRELEKAADQTGIPLKKFIDNIDEIDGRYLLINAFKNAGKGLASVFKAMGDAWKEIFPPMSSDTLFNIIAGLHKFSTHLVVSKETADNLKRTLKGVFAILDIVLTFTGGPIKVALKLLMKLLGAMDLNILDVTAKIGDAIVKFRDWLDSIVDFNKVFEFLAPLLQLGIDAVKGLFDALKNADLLKKFAEYLKSSKDAISDWIKGLKESENIPKYIFGGLINGLKNGIKTVVDFVTNLGKKIIEAICKVLGIESPSTEFFEIGKNIIQGLINGIKNGFSSVANIFKNLGTNIKNWLKEPIMGSGMNKGDFASLLLFGTGFGLLTKTLTGSMKNVGFNILKGLAGGITSGLSLPFKAIIGVGKALINGIKKLLGIHSPSTEFFEIGENIIQGLVNGIKNLAPSLSKLFSKIFGSLEKIEWTSIANFLTFFTSLVPGLSKLNIGAAFARLMSSIGIDSMEGLMNGFKNCFGNVVDLIMTIGKAILNGICKVLGIESPSKEFFEVGKNIIQGLINGIKNGLSAVGTTMKNLGLKCIEFIKSIDWGKLFAAGLGVGMLVVGKTMLGVINNVADAASKFAQIGVNLSAPAKGLGNLLTDVGNSLENFSKGYKAAKRGEMIKDIAIAIALLAASVFVLSKIEVGTLWATIGALTALVALIGVLAFAMSKMNTLKDSASSALSGLSIASIGVALLLIATTMKIISKINPDRTGQVILGLAGAVVALGVLFVVMGKALNGVDLKNVHKLGKMVKKIAWALLLLVVVIKLASMLKGEDLVKGIAVIGTLGLFIAGLIGVSKLGGENAAKAGKMISKISFALLIMIGVIKLASMLKSSEISRGIGVIAGVGLLFTALIAVSNLAGKNATKAGWMLLQMSMALLITVGVIKLASMLDGSELKRGLGVVTTLGLLFAGLIAVSNLAGKNAIKAGTMILMISTALLILTGVLFILSSMDQGKIWKALGIVTVLELLMMGLIFVSKGVEDCSASIYAMIAAIVVLAGVAALLTLINPEKLLKASVSIGIMMAALSLLVKATGSMGDIKNVLMSLIPLVAVAGVMLLLAAVMSKLKPDVSYESALSLSVMLLALSGAVAILGKMGTSTLPGALTGAAGLLALCVPLVALAGILILMKFADNVMTNVMGLSILLGVMTGVLVVLSLVGTALAPGAFVGALALLALCVPLVAIAGILILMNNVNDAMGNVKALSILLITMTGVLTILALVGPLAFVGISALTQLTLFMTALGVFAVAIGALMQKFPQIQSFLDTGLPVLIQLAGAIGEMIGAFVGGVLTQISNSLPSIGANLSLFMTNATPFIVGAKMVDDKVLKGMGILAGSILALCAANVIEAVTTFLSGGTSFADLGTQLSQFMINASEFIVLSKQIDPAIMTGMKSLAEAIMIITGANILDGLTSWLTGGNSLANVGTQLGGLGTNLKTFVTNLGTFNGGQVSTVECACNALKALSEAAHEIPNEGGLWASIVGENSLANFGAQLSGVGTNLSDFVSNLGTFGEDQINTVDCAGRAIKALAEAASEIPNEGGLWSSIVGENSLASFGAKLPGLGTNLNEFITNLGTFGEDQINTVDCAGNAIKALAEAADKIPSEGGFWAKIFGDNSISTFGEKLPGLGTHLKGFISNIGEFGKDHVNTVNSATKAISAFADLGKINLDDTGSSLGGFGDNMVSFGGKINEFVSSLTDTSGKSIDSAVDKTKKLVEMAKTIASTSIDSLGNFAESLKKVATDGVNGFVSEFTETDPKAKVSAALKAMLQAGIDGAEDKKPEVTDKFKSIAKAASDALSDSSYVDSAKSAGKALVEGFADGIDKNTYLATAKAKAMADAAEKAAKEALDINSPSKVFRKIGKSVPEGFAQGITMLGSKVNSSVTGMSDTAISGTKNAIARIADAINTDIDSQPTIRPVLDLSDVESGAGSIGALFSNGPSIGVMSNLRAISSGMNTRNQNGTNDDVISAINKLGKSLGNSKGDTYNLNGLTYNDDSNIADAVRTIVRAARMERRN